MIGLPLAFLLFPFLPHSSPPYWSATLPLGSCTKRHCTTETADARHLDGGRSGEKRALEYPFSPQKLSNFSVPTWGQTLMAFSRLAEKGTSAWRKFDRSRRELPCPGDTGHRAKRHDQHRPAHRLVEKQRRKAETEERLE